MIYYLLALLVIAIDQGSKYLVVHNLNPYEEVPVIGDFFGLTLHRNRGAAFSILQEQRLFFIIITVVVVSGIVYYMQRVLRERKVLLPTALGFLLGGALGNFIDRALTGEVVDFLMFNFRFSWFGHPVDYTFPIFNIADTAITIGVALIILDTLLAGLKERKEKRHDTESTPTEETR
ncbi:signal peptidase II [Gorillibacterium sp. sgz500922]|uniref:signal peptidase II n=1 Tax=Gorillibacterium sp. sgz500922 TaxID=3446694 RepID=UPI003F67AB5C